MKVKNILAVLVVLFISVGCKKEVHLREGNINDELLIMSFFSPQSASIEVELLVAFTHFKDGRKIDANTLKDANVEITHAGVAKKLYWAGVNTYNGQRYIYRVSTSELPVIAGEKYELKVTLPDGLTAIAETVVPKEPLEMSAAYTSYDNNRIRPRYLVTGTARLYPSAKDFYRIGVYRDGFSTDVIADDYFDASKNPSDILSFHFDISGSFVYHAPDAGVIVSLINKDYYYFAESIKNNSRINENPFTEPSSLYTNVKGGLGVFTSFNSKRAGLYFL